MVPAAPAATRAASYYVSPTGNDANAGTLAAPWRTVKKAAATVRPGDVVNLRAGAYREMVRLTRSGTAAKKIVFRSHPGEAAVLDGTGLSLPASSAPLFHLLNCSHVTIENLEFRNLATVSDRTVPMGILIEGSGAGIRLNNCQVHHIQQNNRKKYQFKANAHGIAAYGTAASPISGLVIENCRIHDLRLGASEALVLNGNVTDFQILNNSVRDCNNIGIDLIGYEGTNRKASLDRARGGVVRGNRVSGIDSSTNPAYGGGLTSGGGDYCAAGIYVDGGTRILIERNEVWNCNIGIELASEHQGRSTDFITVRNNVVRDNHISGLALGGYDSRRGATADCRVENNTLVDNNTVGGWDGQVMLQYHISRCVFRNNIVAAPAGLPQMIVGVAALGTGNQFDYNLYFVTGGEAGDLEFEVGGRFYPSLDAWKRAGFDRNSLFADPAFAASGWDDYSLPAGSPAINRGDPAFVPAAGEWDFAGLSRLVAGRVDIGAHEAK